MDANLGTQNDSLGRKSNIFFGDAAPFNAFDPSKEWQSFAQDDFSRLGQYNFNPTLPTQTILPAADVPVPGTLLLMLLGLSGVVFQRSRRCSQALH